MKHWPVMLDQIPIFQNFMYETKIIMNEYVVPQWLFSDTETDEWDDLEWPWIAIFR